MSYILDALRKSEQERKRGDVPGLQTTHIPLNVESSAPRGLYGLILLLLLLLAFVVGLLVADRHPFSGEQKAAATVERPAPGQQAGNETGVKQVEQPVAAEVTTEEVIRDPQAEALTEEYNVPVEAERPQVASEGLVDVPLNEIPYLHELPESRQQSIPELSFAGHVYSSSPDNRFVIINGANMSEGERVMVGLILEQITPSGVVFSFQGELFRVDILQDWSFE